MGQRLLYGLRLAPCSARAATWPRAGPRRRARWACGRLRARRRLYEMLTGRRAFDGNRARTASTRAFSGLNTWFCGPAAAFSRSHSRAATSPGSRPSWRTGTGSASP